MVNSGQRDRFIQVERKISTSDGYGDEIDTWSSYCSEWAAVRFSAGNERRAAAQEAASAAATFIVLSNSLTRQISVADRIQFDGGIWDITSNIPSRQFNAEREIEARRASA